MLLNTEDHNTVENEEDLSEEEIDPFSLVQEWLVNRFVEEETSLQFVLVDTASCFELLLSAHSLVFVGGTLSPVCVFLIQLFLSSFCCHSLLFPPIL